MTPTAAEVLAANLTHDILRAYAIFWCCREGWRSRGNTDRFAAQVAGAYTLCLEELHDLMLVNRIEHKHYEDPDF